jgi:phage regulator Rha-like protein
MLSSKTSLAQAQKERRITSLEMAFISQKNHKELLRSIRGQEIGWEKVTGRKFALSEYTDASGRKLPMYEFNQAESLYIASKFDDVVRAKLVVRWLELEQENQSLKRQLKLREDEQQLVELLRVYLLPGDQKKIAEELRVSPRHVSHVKCGRRRSGRVLAALVDRAIYNKRTGRQLLIGYDCHFVRTSLEKLS